MLLFSVSLLIVCDARDRNLAQLAEWKLRATGLTIGVGIPWPEVTRKLTILPG